jgi:hypothetical protein
MAFSVMVGSRLEKVKSLGTFEDGPMADGGRRARGKASIGDVAKRASCKAAPTEVYGG